MPIIALAHQEDRCYKLSLLNADVQQDYDLEWLRIEYRYLPRQTELQQIKQQGAYRSNPTLQRQFFRQFHEYAKVYNQSNWYKHQCEQWLSKERVAAMLQFQQASPFYNTVQHRMDDLLAGKEFAHFSSSTLIGVYEHLLRLENYLRAVKQQVEENFQKGEKWYLFWHKKMPKELYKSILIAIQGELKKVKQYQTAYTKTIMLRLTDGVTHKDPRQDNVIINTLLMLQEAGIHPCQIPEKKRCDISPQLLQQFQQHILKYGSQSDRQKLQGQFWYREDAHLAIPITWLKGASTHPVPKHIEHLVPTHLKEPAWLHRDHDFCANFFKNHAFFFAEINGLAEKAIFPARFDSIDFNNFKLSSALQQTHEFCQLLDGEISRLEQLKPPWWSRLFFLNTHHLITAWQQELKRAKKTKLGSLYCEFCDNLYAEISKMENYNPNEIQQQIDNFFSDIEAMVQDMPALKVRFYTSKEKIQQVTNTSVKQVPTLSPSAARSDATPVESLYYSEVFEPLDISKQFTATALQNLQIMLEDVKHACEHNISSLNRIGNNITMLGKQIKVYGNKCDHDALHTLLNKLLYNVIFILQNYCENPLTNAHQIVALTNIMQLITVEAKLFPQQEYINSLATLVQMKKFEECKSFLNDLREVFKPRQSAQLINNPATTIASL